MFTNKKGFAIRLRNSISTPNKVALFGIFKRASEELPKFKVEGINKNYKKPLVEKIPLVRAETPTHNIEAGILAKVPRNLICMGVSKRADVTFEAENTIRLNAFVSLVPIFDLELHFNIIIERIAAYLLAAYGWKILSAKPKAAKKAKKVKKTLNYNRELAVSRNVLFHVH